ncbi:DUF2627 domain-containing protein [Bacillaceae bacterium]
MLWQRLLACLVIAIPGVVGMYGVKLMRDAFFDTFDPRIGEFLWWKFLFGLLCFAAGVAFIGGFILHRDRKRNLVQPRFRKNKQRD